MKVSAMILCCGVGFGVLLPVFADDDVDDFARDFIAKEKIPGLSLAVVRNGKVVKAAGYGLANVEASTPATAETVYEIGSITKQFTAEAILLLMEDGKLTLDDPLGKYVEGISSSWAPITLRHLLTHTSGLKDWEGPGLLSFGRDYTPAEFIAVLATHPLDFAPGDKWSYTNSAFPLLGLVVTRVSGTPYPQFVAERIFRPLGLEQARFLDPREPGPHRAQGYVDVKGQLQRGEPRRPTILLPNGGILASALQLAKWTQIFSSELVLKRSSLDLMQTPVRLNNGQTFPPGGIALFMGAENGHRYLVHNGSTAAGFSSVFYCYPDNQLAVVVLCNIDRGDAVNRIATHIAGLYLPAATKP